MSEESDERFYDLEDYRMTLEELDELKKQYERTLRKLDALQNLVESLKIERSVLRTEVKAWRSMPRLDHIIGTYWEHGEDYMDALTDAKEVTDTLNLLGDER